MSSLSPRSSLSSLSPPCSPPAAEPGEAEPEGAGPEGGEGPGGAVLGLDLHQRLAQLELDSTEQRGGLRGPEERPGPGGTTGEEGRDSAPQLRGAGTKKVGVTSAVSDESVAGDSGVYEPSERKPDLPLGSEELPAGCPQVQLGFRYQAREQRFAVCVLQLNHCGALGPPPDQHMYVRLAVLPCSHAARCLFRTRGTPPRDAVQLGEVFGMQISQNALRQKTLRVDVCNTGRSGHEECLAGAQISLLDVGCSEDWSTRCYNLLSRVFLPDDGERRAAGGADPSGVSSSRTGAQEEEDWPGDVFEEQEADASEGATPPEEEEEFYPEGGQWEAEEPSKPPIKAPPLTEKVNKETSVSGLPARRCSAVRPKERPPFLRGGAIIRSQTFSPGPQSQYICRINRSDSDSSTLSKRSPFVRNASERRSMRMKKPPLQVKGLDGLLRTSLDLELDLQVSRTRQARLAQELRVLRELKAQLEAARQRGQRELPAWVQQDERFRLLLRHAEQQTPEEQLQEKRVEKMMRAAAKDVHKIRGQSRKEVPEVQTFREKMAFFTRAKSSIPDLPAADV